MKHQYYSISLKKVRTIKSRIFLDIFEDTKHFLRRSPLCCCCR